MNAKRPAALTVLMASSLIALVPAEQAHAAPPSDVVFEFGRPELDRILVTNVARTKQGKRRWRYGASFVATGGDEESLRGVCRITYDPRTEKTSYSFKGFRGRPRLKGKVVVDGATGRPNVGRLKVLLWPKGSAKVFKVPQAHAPGNGSGSQDPSDPQDPVDPPTSSALALEAGTFWVFGWESERSGYSGTSTFRGESEGVVTVVLGEPERHVANGRYVDAFPVDATVRTMSHWGTDTPEVVAPAWTHLAIAEGELLGSGNGGQTYVPLYAASGSWNGLSLFHDPGLTGGAFSTQPGSKMVNGEAVSLSLVSGSWSASDRSCTPVPGGGTACTGSNTGASWFREDYVKAGIGPIGYFFRNGGHSDDGGTTGYSELAETRVILQSTSLKGDDGWQPDGEWGFGRPMPFARAGFAAVALGGRIYAIGGVNASLEATGAVDAFDPVKNSWTALSAPTHLRGLVSAAVLDGAIYATNGIELERYDPDADAWTTLSAPPQFTYTHPRTGEEVTGGVVGPNCVAANGHLRVLCESGQVLDYDPQTDSWASFDLPLFWQFSAGGVGMSGDGAVVAQGQHVIVADRFGFYGFDPYVTSGDPFTHLAQPAGLGYRYGLSLAAGPAGVYLTGGLDADDEPAYAAYNFLPVLSAAVAIPELLIGRYLHASVVLDGKLYVLGGATPEHVVTDLVTVLAVQ